MVSSCGRGFDSLQLHYRCAGRTLTLVRVLFFEKRPAAERDSLQLHYRFAGRTLTLVRVLFFEKRPALCSFRFVNVLRSHWHSFILFLSVSPLLGQSGLRFPVL